ncbi:50S ribosomal protein L1 [archaeon]|nr:50S ribosomal protein L1 [archaeon]
MKLLEAIKKAKEDAPERKFVESIDVFVNFKNVDFNKSDNKINLELLLPNGRGKPRKICLFCSEEMAAKAKKAASKIILKDEMASIDKKQAKKLANEYNFFVAEAPLMPEIGKRFGQVLAPRGKMPKPIPPGANPESLIKSLEKTLSIKTKGKNMPVLHAPIGTVEMTDEQLTQNAESLINAISGKLPQKQQNIKAIFIKTTMGPTVRVEV